MKNEINKVLKISVLLLCVYYFYNKGFIPVEAATKLPDNHAIEQLDVKFVDGVEGEYGSYLIDVGDRKGTLMIRIDPPEQAWNIQWVNWALREQTGIPFYLHTEKDKSKHPEYPKAAPFYFGSTGTYDYLTRGEPDKWSKESGVERIGLMRVSGHSNPPTYYIGLSVYLSKKYNSDGVYYFTGDQSALKEAGQVKAYFFNDVDVVTEAYDRVKDVTGTFPLMNKVMWGKTELWKGQLGKMTIKKPTTLWLRADNGSLTKVRDLKAGDEYRVYRYLNEKNGLYGVGGGMFVEKNANTTLYETPSKRNLRLMRIMNGEE